MKTPPTGPPNCSFCHNKGCAACFNARRDWDREYDRQFPNGPQPIFTAHMDNPTEMAVLRKVFHRIAIEEAFGPEGGGMAEVLENLKMAKAQTEAKS